MILQLEHFPTILQILTTKHSVLLMYVSYTVGAHIDFAYFYRRLLHTLITPKKWQQLLLGLHLLQEVVILLSGKCASIYKHISPLNLLKWCFCPLSYITLFVNHSLTGMHLWMNMLLSGLIWLLWRLLKVSRDDVATCKHLQVGDTIWFRIQ